MPFELFTSDKAVPRGEPMVTLTSYGRLAFNKPATRKLETAEVKFVQLLWNAEERKVAIRPSSQVKDAFTLAYGDNGNGAAFTCIKFLNYIQYDWTKTRNFSVEWDDQNGMYVFSIASEYLGKSVDGSHIKRGNANKRSLTADQLLGYKEGGSKAEETAEAVS